MEKARKLMKTGQFIIGAMIMGYIIGVFIEVIALRKVPKIITNIQGYIAMFGGFLAIWGIARNYKFKEKKE